MALRRIYDCGDAPMNPSPWNMGAEDDEILMALQYKHCTLPGVPPNSADYPSPSELTPSSSAGDPLKKKMKETQRMIDELIDA
jgi:hypothetical protein